jgi:hypothetical protein
MIRWMIGSNDNQTLAMSHLNENLRQRHGIVRRFPRVACHGSFLYSELDMAVRWRCLEELLPVGHRATRNVRCRPGPGACFADMLKKFDNEKCPFLSLPEKSGQDL